MGADAAGAAVDQHQLTLARGARSSPGSTRPCTPPPVAPAASSGRRRRDRHAPGRPEPRRIRRSRRPPATRRLLVLATIRLMSSPTSATTPDDLHAEDFAGARRRRVLPGGLQHVGPIDSGGADLDQHLALAGGDIGHFLPRRVDRRIRRRWRACRHATTRELLSVPKAM